MRTSVASAYVAPLGDLLPAAEAGGKAANLARLIRMRQPVPDGFVITNAALRAFLAEHDLDSPIAAACADLDTRSPSAIKAASDAIAALIRACPVPSAIRTDLDVSLTPFLEHRLIVRSSAVGEDSNDASFAGQLDSIADVSGAARIRQALVDVWTSRWSARALTYQLARGRSLAGMGVIVQRQVRSSVSGVLFTVSPTNADEMLIEYCEGSGESLVAGRENPGRLTIARAGLRWSKQAAPERPIAHEDTLVNDAQVRALARRALDIERAFGRPQDIEWTMDGDGRLWIVQTRPITVSVRPPTARLAARVHWSNANVNENFPEPISPLLYSIARTGYYHYFRNLGRAFGFSERRLAAMEQPLRHIIGVHGARMYYNLSSIHGVLRSAPFGDLLARWFNEFVGSEDTETGAYVDRRVRLKPDATLVAQAGELAVIVAKTAWQFLFVARRVERFERTVVRFAMRTRPDRLRDRSRQDLVDDLRAFIDIRNNRWKDASLADAASMVCYGALKLWLTRAFPAEDQAALHNSLLKALPGIPSSLPAVELWDLSRLVRSNERLRHLIRSTPAAIALSRIQEDDEFVAFRQALDGYLERWGFRCSGELMLTVPSFQETPAPLLDIIKAYALMDGQSPADHLQSQRDERRRETGRVAAALARRRLVRALPLVSQWHLVARLLAWTQKSIVLRERARLKQALLYSRLRRIALALGDRLVAEGRLEHQDDIFFLTADEIDDLVSGYAMFPDHVQQLVSVRRRAHLELGKTAPPDSIRLGEGDYLRPCSNRRVSDQPGTGAALTGIGVCGGRTTARAAVLTDVGQAHLLQPGDVLVTRQTDPGWGAVFPLISGLVMERGGMLSHGAIIAREFGIPSVVGIGSATKIVPHGCSVHVDGDRGLVTIQGPA
jgi:rifampicin phosphotransferase